MAVIKIKSGDTLSGLAQQQNTTVDELLKLNPNITDPNLIIAGADLNIPDITSTTQEPTLESISAGIQTTAQKTTQLQEAIQPLAPLTTTTEEPEEIDIKAQEEAIQAELDAFQASQRIETGAEVETRGIEEIIDVPDVPVRPDTAQELTDLRARLGVDPLEQEVIDFDKQIADIEARFREQTGEERFISRGFRSTANRKLAEEANEQIAAINREKQVVVSQLNNKLNTIELTMRASQIDFQQAREDYEFAFNKNLALTQIINQERDKAINRAEAIWSTTTDFITQGLTSGSIVSYESLPDNIKNDLRTQELQLGLPTGFTELMLSQISQIAPEKTIVQKIVSADKTQVSIIFDDGTVQVISTGLTPSADRDIEGTPEFLAARQFILDNKGATFNELFEGIKNSTTLTPQQINDLLEDREDIQAESKEITNAQLLTAAQAMSVKDVISFFTARFTSDEIKKLAREEGFEGGGFLGIGISLDKFYESPEARKAISKLLGEQFVAGGFTITQ